MLKFFHPLFGQSTLPNSGNIPSLAPSIRPTKRSRALLAEGFFYYSPEFECLRHPPKKTTIYENTLVGQMMGCLLLFDAHPMVAAGLSLP